MVLLIQRNLLRLLRSDLTNYSDNVQQKVPALTSCSLLWSRCSVEAWCADTTTMLSFREGTAPSDPTSAKSFSNCGLINVTWTSRDCRSQQKKKIKVHIWRACYFKLLYSITIVLLLFLEIHTEGNKLFSLTKICQKCLSNYVCWTPGIFCFFFFYPLVIQEVSLSSSGNSLITPGGLPVQLQSDQLHWSS